MVEVEGTQLGLKYAHWQEVPIPYEHSQPRCWHEAAVIPEGELYIHSGLTQPFYITRDLLTVNILCFVLFFFPFNMKCTLVTFI